VVTITTPGGVSTTTPSAANSLIVLPATGTSPAQLISSEVEVLIAPSGPAPVATTYGPVVSLPVEIQMGPIITGVTPDRAAIGDSGVRVRITGNNLTETTSIQFVPADGITIQDGSLVKAADGGYVEVVVNIALDAPVAPRTVVAHTSSGVAMPAAAGVNILTVTLRQPEITVLLPNYGAAGSPLTMKVYGRNLKGATAVDVLPPTGVSVQNPLTVSDDGTMVTVNLTIDPEAATGSRVVTITTPGGVTTTTPSAANSLKILPATGTSPVQLMSEEVEVRLPPSDSASVATTYGPVVSTEVEVILAPPLLPVTHEYGPVLSVPVEVTIGAAITGMTPHALEPGSSGAVVLTGVGLTGVTKVEILPADGITISAWSVGVDGALSVPVTVAATAPTAPRQFLVTTEDGPIRSPFAMLNPLLVGPKPVIVSIDPIQESVGSTFTLNIRGRYLTGATQVRFEPSGGIQVDMTPTVSSDGTLVTVKVVLDPTAMGGERAVIVVTPYGASSSIATAANTFKVYHPVAPNMPSRSSVSARRQSSQPMSRVSEYPANDARVGNDRLSFLGIEGRRIPRKNNAALMALSVEYRRHVPLADSTLTKGVTISSARIAEQYC